MSELDTKLYDAMGQRFAVVKVIKRMEDNKVVEGHEVTANPERYFDTTVIAKDLKYSEAEAIIKLMGGG